MHEKNVRNENERRKKKKRGSHNQEKQKEKKKGVKYVAYRYEIKALAVPTQ